MKAELTRAIYLLVFFALAGCAPGLGGSLDVSSIHGEPVEISKLEPGEGGIQPKVNIPPIEDRRVEPHIAQIDGRLVEARGDLGISVQRLYQDLARTKGFEVRLFDAPTIAAELLVWRADVTPALWSSSVSASAKVRVRLIDDTRPERFAAVFSGSFTREHPLLDEDDVIAALGMAMHYALSESLSDPKLRAALSASQR